MIEPSRQLAAARSFLFCPADVSRRLERALGSDADVVIVDLEDGVAPGHKEQARRALSDVSVGTQGPAIVVRVNAVDTEDCVADLRAIGQLDPAAIMVPKATPRAVEIAGRSQRPLIALIETARGLLSAPEIAQQPQVSALALGGGDLAVELRLEERADGQELAFARGSMVAASAAAGLRAPIDVVHLDVRDDAGLADEAALARSLGFGGKLCIHPRQLRDIHNVFTPSATAVDAARRIVASYEEALSRGEGVGLVDGRLVDAPVAARAREIITHDQGAR